MFNVVEHAVRQAKHLLAQLRLAVHHAHFVLGTSAIEVGRRAFSSVYIHHATLAEGPFLVHPSRVQLHTIPLRDTELVVPLQQSVLAFVRLTVWLGLVGRQLGILVGQILYRQPTHHVGRVACHLLNTAFALAENRAVGVGQTDSNVLLAVERHQRAV